MFKEKLKHIICYMISATKHLFWKKDVRRILVLHDVKNSQKFEEKILWLKKNYQIVNLDLLLSKKLCGDAVALTFDDGYSNWISNALPVLEKFKIPATFFVNSGILQCNDKQSRNSFAKLKLKRNENLSLVTLEEFRLLSNSEFVEIGSHSVNHVDFGKVSSPRKCLKELRDDKIYLERLVWPKSIIYFAVPFGHSQNFNESTLKGVKYVGFKNCFSILPENISSRKSNFLIGRSCVSVSNPNWVWQMELRGGRDFFKYVK